MAAGSGHWDRIGRVAGSLGVILSLVFVGLQVRQAATLARAQTRQALSESNAQALQPIAENRDLARAWSLRFLPNAPDSGRLNRTDSLQTAAVMFALLRHVENVYLQYREGVIDESVLGSYGFRENALFITPAFASYWESLKISFDERFVTAFDAEYDLASPR
jgi:hypothetical protein